MDIIDNLKIFIQSTLDFFNSNIKEIIIFLVIDFLVLLGCLCLGLSIYWIVFLIIIASIVVWTILNRKLIKRHWKKIFVVASVGLILSGGGGVIFDFEPPGDSVWWDTDWGHSKKIIIDSDYVDNTLTNFPILFDNISIDFENAQADGDDFVFVASDNSTVYKHEIERFNVSDDNRLIAWVNITSLSSSVDTVLWLYYGNSTCGSQEDVTGTWNSGYQAVWHFNETSGTVLHDATSNDEDGTIDGSSSDVTLSQTGITGYSWHFDASGSNSGQVDSDASINGGSALEPWVVETWINLDSQPTQWGNVVCLNGAGNGQEDYPTQLEWNHPSATDVLFGAYNTDAWSTSTCSLGNTAWDYGVVVADGTDTKVYWNGSLETTDSADSRTISGVWTIGGRCDNTNEDTDGYIDEVRISNVERNASWINTTHNTIRNPDTFITVGSENSVPTGDIPTNSNPSPTNNAVDVGFPVSTLAITVSDPNGDSMDITFRTNESGTWKDADTNSSVSNGTYYCINTTWINPQTKYWWSVNTTDNNDGWDNDTYIFTTGENWSEWSKSRQFNISNPIVGYQMWMKLYNTTGTDVWEDGKFYCGAFFNSNFSDIRFRNKTMDKKLDYWIENTSAGNWVELWIETDGEDTFYLNYSNDNAPPDSDGDETFTFFEDFGQTITITNNSVGDWTRVDTVNGSHWTDSDWLYWNGTIGPCYLTTDAQINWNQTARWRGWLKDEQEAGENIHSFALQNASQTITEDNDAIYLSIVSDMNGVADYKFCGGDGEYLGSSELTALTYDYDYITIFETSHQWNRTVIKNYDTNETYTSIYYNADGMRVGFGSCATPSQHSQCDWVLVRNWSYTPSEFIYNHSVNVSAITPAHQSTDVSQSTSQLSIYMADAEGDKFDWNIETSPDVGDSSDTGASNGTKTCSVSGLAYSTLYTWYVNISDSGDGVRKHTYNFTTEAEPSTYSYYKQFWINASMIDDDLVNFPVLVSISSDSDLANHTQSDADDIRFTNGSNPESGTQYNHQIEYWNNDSNYVNASIWVNITYISSSSNTTFYMHYGNSSIANQENITGTWNSDFVMVHHMDGSVYTELDDSTSNNNDVTKDNDTVVYQQTGKIGHCIEFDGSHDYLEVDDSNSLDITGDLTIEVWGRPDDFDNNMLLLTKRGPSEGDDATPYFIAMNDNSGGYFRMLLGSGATYYYPSTTPSTLVGGNWYYGVGRVDGTDLYALINVTEAIATDTFASGSRQENNEKITVGVYAQTGNYEYYFDGLMDEVRISNIARNNSWLNATYDNVNDYTGFIDMGSEQELETTYTETVRTDGVDYFVYLGVNQTASTFDDDITGFDDAGETISILGDDGDWDTWTGAGTGTDFTLSTFDVIKIILADGEGTIEIIMVENIDMSYDDRTYTLVDVGNGYNYTAFTGASASDLGTEADAMSMINGELISIWDDDNYIWIHHIQGTTYNTDEALSQLLLQAILD